jgi:hypothetical protein
MIKETLTNKEGFVNLKYFIPSYLITAFNKRMSELTPVRASSSQKQYAEGENIKNLPDISVWWSQVVDNWPEVIKIRRILDPLIIQNFTRFQFYVSDVVTIKGKSTWINPHVDTPHRFDKWNFDEKL